ncbi:S49 family peptidase [Chloroflexota bacterium]
MLRLESTRRLLRRWFTSIPFFVVLGLVIGGLIAVPLIPKPNIAIINISGTILGEAYVADILDMLHGAQGDNRIRAVVLRIDSPGGGASATEQIFLDMLRLRQKKPVVVSIGPMAASGGYYIAVASNFIYAEPTSQIGSIGAWVSMPEPEELDEDIGSTGPFKATGRSRRSIRVAGNITRRSTVSVLEMVRQGFVEAIMSQRGERIKLSGEELSRAEIYPGIESLRYGLIDDIGTRTDAVEKAASLAGIRNYEVVELNIISQPLFLFFGSADLATLKSQTGLMPVYYYLYFEQE